MNRLAFLFLSLLIIFSGCVYKEEPLPQITGRTKPVIIPETTRPAIVQPSGIYPAGWLPPRSVEKDWTAIVIHHSATNSGNASIFDRWHRENHGWEGVGYNFVIGNGSDSGDGQVEVTFRWNKQMTGAHVGGTSGNWANREAIGICLVGDFNKTSPSYRQMASLRKLVKFLQDKYNIPTSRIYGHGTTPGAKETDCPGRNFPMAQFKRSLN